ncbi:hypothetical protein HanLR1_Chr13g0480371 [Helianthus annuus]|nr:hypothetical protein HanLR1_Chr13g0480371 [Helianthus annuus]
MGGCDYTKRSQHKTTKYKLVVRLDQQLIHLHPKGQRASSFVWHCCDW